MKPKRIISGVADVAAFLLFVYLIIFPQYAAGPTRYAIEFCTQTLVPSLFVYMVLAKMVISLPFTDKLMKVIGLESFALLSGTLCGCPMGAKNAMTLYESGRISKKQAEYLCSFTNNASLSFVVGFVGNELFGDVKMGLKLLIFQLLASLVTAAVLRYTLFKEVRLHDITPCKSEKTGLREAVSDSAFTMITLCACAVFFIVAGNAISGLMALSPIGDGILKSLLEFSSGCAAAVNSGKYAFPIAAFAIGQTGLSVAMQVKSIVGNKLAMKPFFAGKIISSVVMTALAIIFG